MAQLEINYALAMKDISLEKGVLKDNQIIVKDIIKLIEENEDFEKILSSSFIIKEEKHNLIDNVFSSSINKDLLSFFHVIIENNRANLFLSILKEFNSLCNEYYGVVEGLCYSAFLLDKKQIEKLEKTLSKKEGKTIVLKNKVNPSLIGGVKIVINDHVYDSTVVNKIDNIKKNLLV